MHINVILGCQLDKHFLFWQPIVSIILYLIACTYCFCIEMEIKYDTDDDDDDDDISTDCCFFLGSCSVLDVRL